MAYIKSLDEEHEEGTLHDVIGKLSPAGAKPLPLKSSWHLHERFVAPPRKPVHVYFLDCRETGETLCKVRDFRDLPAAIKALTREGLDVVVRPHIIDDISLEHEAQERRTARQLGTYML